MASQEDKGKAYDMVSEEPKEQKIEEINTYNLSDFQQAEVIITDSKTGKKMTFDEYRNKILSEDNDQ